MSETQTQPNRRLTGEQRRERFLDAAVAIIRDQGVDAVTMEGIAERSGVNKALGYRYFANRDQLLIALADREFVRIDALVANAVATCTTFDARIAAILGVYMDAYEADGMLMFEALARPGSGDAALESHHARRVVGILQFFADQITADHDIAYPVAFRAAAMFSAGVTGLLALWNVTGGDRAQFIEDGVTMCNGALRALEEASR